jgi:hypothetical protein
MKAIERIIGVGIGAVLLAAVPAAAAPAGVIGWRTAAAVAAQRVPGDILAARLEGAGPHPVYGVTIRTTDQRLERVRVDGYTAHVLGVRPVAEPGILGEFEAP